LLGSGTQTSFDGDCDAYDWTRADDTSTKVCVDIIRSDDELCVNTGGLFDVERTVVQAVDDSALGCAVC
jgi:hypothetical protein